MKCLDGKCVSNQIVIAPLLFFRRAAAVSNMIEEAPEDACDRIMKAREQAVSFCCDLIHRAEKEDNQEAKAIFAAQKMLLEDILFTDSILDKIKNENLGTVMAVVRAGEEIKNSFRSTGNEMLQAKMSDVDDVVSYYLQALGAYNSDYYKDRKEASSSLYVSADSGVIVMASELTPAETMKFLQGSVAGFVTKDGSALSHVSILARSFGIPALYGIEVSDEYDGCLAIIDGEKECLIIRPDEETLLQYKKKQEDNKLAEEILTQDENQYKWRKYANVANLADARDAFVKGAEGIGLYRSECMLFGRKSVPTEEEQFLFYKELLETAENREVVIRVFDIGSDKKCPYLLMEEEDNPALGIRGIRYLLKEKELFDTQLRALYRASSYGRLSILFPMITALSEVKQIRLHCEKICREMETCPDMKRKSCKDVRIGMMIETPAAALITDLIAKECDFISIGTNDLLQYLMATDRDSELADIYLVPEHPAVKKLIKQVIYDAHTAGCEVCICGELAANPSMRDFFDECGADVLSVSY